MARSLFHAAIVAIATPVLAAGAPAGAAGTDRPVLARGGFFNAVEYTCTHARLIVESKGYEVVRRADCAGDTYGFVARKGGRLYYVTFDARWGWIERVEPIPRQ